MKTLLVVIAAATAAWGQSVYTGTWSSHGTATLTRGALTGAIPASFFGMHFPDGTSPATGWPTQITVGYLAKGAGTTWAWVTRNCNPSQNPCPVGQYVWDGVETKYANSALAHGVDFFYSNDNVPKWAVSSGDYGTCDSNNVCDTAPADVDSGDQNWKDYVTNLVTHMGTKIPMYELWNEPHNSGSMTVARMVTMHTDEYNIIRALAPAGTLICLPGFMGGQLSYFSSYLAQAQAVGSSIFNADCVGLHINSYNSVPDNKAEDILVTLNTMKATLASYGLGSKPIWQTENGRWSGCGNNDLTLPDDQMAFVARSQLLFYSTGAVHHMWYAWDSCGKLWDNGTGALTSAGVAYQNIQTWMIGNAMTQACSGPLPPSYGVWTCGITKPNGAPLLVVWDSSKTCNPSCAYSTYTPDPKYTQYYDLNGAAHSIVGNSVQIGAKPVALATAQ